MTPPWPAGAPSHEAKNNPTASFDKPPSEPRETPLASSEPTRRPEAQRPQGMATPPPSTKLEANTKPPALEAQRGLDQKPTRAQTATGDP